MTTAMLLTFGLALGTSAVAEVKPPVQIQLNVTVFKGDPLGSRAEGTQKILAEPVLRVLPNHTAYFQSGGKVPVPGVDGKVIFEHIGVQLKLTPELKEGDVILLNVGAELAEVVTKTDTILAADQQVSALSNQSLQIRRTLKDSQTMRVRIGAASPTDQTWAEITIHILRPTP